MSAVQGSVQPVQTSIEVPELPKPKFQLEATAIDEIMKNPAAFIGQPIIVSGWVRSVREQPTVSFIVVNDGSTRVDLQVVIPFSPPVIASAKVFPEGLTTGASVRVVGRVVASPAAGQPIDVEVRTPDLVAAAAAAATEGATQSPTEPPAEPLADARVDLVGGVGGGYPLAKARIPLDVLRLHPHLRVRTASIAAAARVRSVAAQLVHSFFHSQGFRWIHTPVLTGADCEGAGEMFQVTTLLHRGAYGSASATETLKRVVQDAREGTHAEAVAAAAKAAKAAKKKQKKGDVKDEGEGEAAAAAPPVPPVEPVDLSVGVADEELYAQDFFKRPVFLTVSGQLNVESYCAGLGKVYTFGPTFRAERSMTTRHLAEFWMIEPEVAFCSVSDLMCLAEDFVRYVVHGVLSQLPQDIEQLDKLAAMVAADAAKQIAKGAMSSKTRTVGGGEGKATGLVDTLKRLVSEPFDRLAYTDAVWLLSQKESVKEHGIPITWGEDLQAPHERWLVESHAGGRPVFVVDWPAEIKSFYMRQNAPRDAAAGTFGSSVPTEHPEIVPDGRATVQGYDLLSPLVGELIGGSQREERFDVLSAMMEKKGMAAEPLSWYMDLRKHGSVPHGGFGLGFERLVMLCTGLQNIRDVIPFPRYPGHCDA